MKRYAIRILLVVMVLATALTGGAVLAQDDAPPQPVRGAVNIIVPDLWVMQVGASEETPIRSPTVLNVGETLRTTETGVALITWFYDGTESTLGPNSSMTLNGFTGESSDTFVLDLELKTGHLLGSVGYIAGDNLNSDWTITTPAFTFRPMAGQFDVWVAEDGTTTLAVTEGRVEIQTAGDPIKVDEGQFVVDGGEPQAISSDGVSVNLSGVCTATASTNINIRLAPNEDSRRLDGVPEGQVFWVRTATEGLIWAQVYFQTDVLDEEGHNYGWVYGPALTFDEAACTGLVQTPLAAQMFGGPGIDKDPQALENMPEAEATAEAE